MYLCELSILDAYTLSFSYSTKAAAALLLAQISLGAPLHTPTMEAAVAACMGAHGVLDLTPCMTVLLRLQQIAYRHTASAVASAAAAAAAAATAGAAAPGTAMFSSSAMPSACGTQAEAQVAVSGPGATSTGAAASEPAAEQSDDLLSPLRIKFGADCWCNVSTAPPIAMV